MNVDSKSKQKFINFLKNNNFYNIQDTDITLGQFASYDVTGSWDNKDFAFEVKERNCSSTTYDDNTVEKLKYDELKKKKESGEIKAGYVVSYYNDGLMAINEIDDSHTESKKLCPSTTCFTNKQKKEKNLIHYPHTAYSLWIVDEGKRIIDNPF